MYKPSESLHPEIREAHQKNEAKKKKKKMSLIYLFKTVGIFIRRLCDNCYQHNNK